MTDQTPPTSVVHIPGQNLQVPCGQHRRQIQRCMVCGILLATSTANAMLPNLLDAGGSPVAGHVTYPPGVPARFTIEGDSIRLEPIRTDLADTPDFCGHLLAATDEETVAALRSAATDGPGQ